MGFYYDDWYAKALEAGVAPELAQLGREVMRDHFQHGSGEHILGEESDGDSMLELCLKDSKAAKNYFSMWLYGDIEVFDADDVAKQAAKRIKRLNLISKGLGFNEASSACQDALPTAGDMVAAEDAIARGLKWEAAVHFVVHGR